HRSRRYRRTNGEPARAPGDHPGRRNRQKGAVIEPMSDILERMAAFNPDGFGSSDPGSDGLEDETLGTETLADETFEGEPLDTGSFEPDGPDPEPFDPETLASAERAADEAGLVSRVSAASFQVSQATEGLDQV